MRHQMLCLAATLSLDACNNTNFKGSSAATPSPAVASSNPSPKATTPKTPAVDPAVETAQVQKTIPGCGTGGVTRAQLLTPTMDMNDAAAHLDYAISRVDCNGVAEALTADKILFDMDSYGMNDNISISILGDGDVETATGNLTRLDGTDLFGHVGLDWAHYETDSVVAIQGVKTSLKIRIHMNGQTLSPRIMPTPAPAVDAAVPIPTYLQFGSALPVTVSVGVIHTSPGPAANLGTSL